MHAMPEPNSERKFLRVISTLAAGLALVVASVASAAEAGGDPGSRPLAKLAATQNVVEAKRAAAPAWVAAEPDQALFGKDRIRTGAASRAAVLYADDTLHRIDENSEVEIVPPDAGEPGILKVLSGRHYFASRKPKQFNRVETSTVTAAIKGTEFAVDVASDGTTTVTMIEGVVLASNEYGSVEVGAGERAVAEPGKAPVRAVVVRPRDAVAWALYYPPVLGGADARRLGELGEDGTALAGAAELLATGQVDEATRRIEDVRKRRPAEPVALSLGAVVALVGDRKDEARDLAGRAVEAGPLSPSAALAASFVAQADFEIARAAELAERAAVLDPQDPTALARVAELRMAQGDVRGALDAADRALERAPADARALTVRGFVDLARLRTAAAAARFERAVSEDSGLAPAHLGRGIARLRLGDEAGGLADIQTAATLDPGNALTRSYLGKAYYELRRPDEALKELAAAKEIDPSDPTPWLYSALVLQNENRPVEALDDLRQAIAKNDNRAVYRSRLLLDEDRAVRSADLARIFNDLGFEDAGLVAARRSADEDQANHSSHSFLAGNYRNRPGFASAFLSEVLQARIYQPVSVNAARPDSVNASASFNEYTALFDRPRLRAFGVVAYGDTDTDLSDYDTGDDCGGVPCYTLSEIDDSRLTRGDVVVTGGGDRFALAVSASTYRDDGFRLNSDEDVEVLRQFAQFALTDRDTVQLNVLSAERKNGDLPIRQIPPAITPERFDTEEVNVGLGWHRKLDPGSDLAVSAIWNETKQSVAFIGGFPLGTVTIDGPQVEAQWVKRAGRATWIAGAGAFDGSVELAPAGGSAIRGDDGFVNGYGYVKLRGFGPFEFTFGAAVEDVEVPVGFLPPRDSNILAASLPYSETEFSPKAGVTATFPSGTTLRAGAYRRLAPFLGRLQTLEPTQVAGFNQFFEDAGGTTSWNYGFGVDQALGRRWFLGASYLTRDLTVPEAYCDRATEWNPFSGCAFVVPSVIEERDDDEERVGAYVSGALARWIVASVAWDREDREFGTTFATPTGAFQDRILTRRLKPEIRLFSARGFFVTIAATHYDQEVDQFDDLGVADRTTVESDFWVTDAVLGYRFPKRWGSFVIEGRNLSNEKFDFYERSVQERVVPARSVVARLEITY